MIKKILEKLWEKIKEFFKKEKEPPVVVEPPKPEPIEEEDQFSYEPHSSFTQIKVPERFGVWQMHIFSRKRHFTLYGPDKTKGPWTIPMSGEQLRKESIAVGDDGTLLVFVNTSNEKTGKYKNAGWRIMQPEKPQYGDKDRLKEGENR